MNITEIAGWTVVGLYVLIALYVLAENLTPRHILGVRRGGWRVVARTALESVAWPVMVFPWQELPFFWRQCRRKVRASWDALPVRYAGVGE